MNIVEWCQKNDIWYLEIDLEVPRDCIREVYQVYDNNFFIPHRYGDGDGWYSSAIHGFVPENHNDTSLAWMYTKNPNGHGMSEESVKWGWSEVADHCPETVRWLKEFPHSNYRRCRFMLLKPGGHIEKHHDANDQRVVEGRQHNIASAINVSITQPDGCYLRRTDTLEELPFQPCKGFWFDNGVEHEAYNGSNKMRFHMIIHGGMNNMRKELMKKSLIKQFGKDVLKELD